MDELQRGLKHQQAGELAQAERIYRSVLAAEPDNADALHLLGIVASQLGKNDKALQLIQRAISLQPAHSSFWNSAGNALKALGRLQEAEHSYRCSLALSPDSSQSHYNLAGVLEQLGQPEAAEASYRQALRLKPDLVEAHYNLGNLLHRLARYAEAERSYREVLGLRPDHAEGHNNLGSTLKAQGRLEDARQSYLRALQFRPAYAAAHYNAGAALQDLARTGEAERSYRQALALQPDLAEAHFNLGALLYQVGKMAEAEQSFRHAVNLRPDHPQAHYNLGMALQGQGLLAEAEKSHRQALLLNPGYSEAHCMWVYHRQQLCMWAALEREVEALRRHVAERRPGRVFPFTFLALPEGNAEEQRECARQYAEVTCAGLLARPPLSSQGSGRAAPKLKIGYLSADYYEHATSYLLVDVVERHDRRRCEIVGYSYGKQDSSAISRRIRAAFPVLRELRALSNEDAARQIAADGVDILVDLKGYTAGSRPELLALRPAPVQVNWLGYPGSLGHRRLADYLIGDPIVTPLEHAGRYAETLALMPHCYQPNDRKREIGRRPAREEAGLPAEGFVFCCFNQSYKITPAMFDLWCRLLRAVPGSVLWLLRTTRAAQANLLREAQARDISPERLVFSSPLPLTEHLGRLQLADLALDTHPVTSHTTASDALWCGIPVATILGGTFISRVAASLMTAAGVPELIAKDSKSYYELALALAREPRRLRRIKDRLRSDRLSCPLFDSERFIRDLESLFDRMWRDRESAEKRPIVLPARRKPRRSKRRR